MPTQPRLSALLDVRSEKEATVVAIVTDGSWQPPSVAGRELVARAAKAGVPYRVFPAGSAAAATHTGTLSGELRERCGEFFVGLSAPEVTQGFAVIETVGAATPVAALPLQSATIDAGITAAVVAVVDRAAPGPKITPKIQRAYRVDLDGDGRPETVVEATHPELLGDPPKYKRQYHSLVVVIPGNGEGQPIFTGYLQAARPLAQFEVVAVDSVVDVDRDGRRELLVRARHAEGWQTQVFRYDGRTLAEVFRSVGGEGDCGGGE